MKIIHRDLKPANILINAGCYKLCDFGFARYVDSVADLLKSCVGSPLYMAPQILDKQRYNYKCDIWSFGIIYFELLHGAVPWRGNNEVDLLKNIKTVQLKVADCFSQRIVKFIQSLLTLSEDKRASWEEVFAFFKLEEDKSMVGKVDTSSMLPTAPNEETALGLSKEYFE